MRFAGDFENLPFGELSGEGDFLMLLRLLSSTSLLTSAYSYFRASTDSLFMCFTKAAS